MPPLRSRLLITALALAVASCTGQAATTVTITLRIDEEALRPDHALLKWRVPGLSDRPAQRLPERGSLKDRGPVLGSVTFEVEASIAGDRDLTVTGFRGQQIVSAARSKVPWVRNGAQQLTLTLTCTPDVEDERAKEACSPSMDPDRTISGVDAGSTTPARPDAGAEVGPDLRSERPPLDLNTPADAAAEVGPELRRPDALPPAPDLRPEPPPPPIEADAGPVDMRLPSGVELGRNLELYLRFDEGGQSLVTADGAGQGVGAALVNLDNAWIKGPMGNALAFPAVTPGWVRVTGAALNALTDNFTLSVWIRSDRVADTLDRRTVVARRAVGPGGFLYSLHLVGNHPALFINSTNGANANFVSTQSLPPNQWVHLALVYDRKVARLWMEGRNVGEVVYMLTIPPENSPLCVGASEDPAPGTATDPLGADLDEVAIYDRALSAEEVAALARGFQPPVR